MRSPIESGSGGGTKPKSWFVTDDVSVMVLLALFGLVGSGVPTSQSVVGSGVVGVGLFVKPAAAIACTVYVPFAKPPKLYLPVPSVTAVWMIVPPASSRLTVTPPRPASPGSLQPLPLTSMKIVSPIVRGAGTKKPKSTFVTLFESVTGVLALFGLVGSGVPVSQSSAGSGFIGVSLSRSPWVPRPEPCTGLAAGS
jgi:hypothetical protein